MGAHPRIEQSLEMSILRRVDDRFRKEHPYPDDGEHVYSRILAELSYSEREEWKRQAREVERMVPEYGSYDAALEAFERMHPDAP